MLVILLDLGLSDSDWHPDAQTFPFGLSYITGSLAYRQQIDLEQPDSLTKELHFTSRLRGACLILHIRYNVSYIPETVLFSFPNGSLGKKGCFRCLGIH